MNLYLIQEHQNSKHCLCGGGCCNDCGSLDTKEVGWGNLWQEEGGQWASEKLRVIVSIKRLWMFIKTFRTLVNHYNCCFDLNSNSPKLNTTYTSHLIFFRPILDPKALLASLRSVTIWLSNEICWMTNESFSHVQHIDMLKRVKLGALP